MNRTTVNSFMCPAMLKSFLCANYSEFEPQYHCSFKTSDTYYNNITDVNNMLLLETYCNKDADNFIPVLCHYQV
jgi:hypothetical protein